MADQTSQDASTSRVVGSTDEVSEGAPLVVDVDDEEIAIFYENGEYFAVNNVCPHQGGPLGNGKVEEECVYCPWHGWGFDIESGDHEHSDHSVETYSVTIEGDDVRVEL
ncbi:Rieske (2Fe-2S) protein [Natronorubrum sp. FCH18a]|uniref:Rieske (2Fe-2S) protein n=1 Tax=Natronorubrum sp. FCH18a TaxID=3447018 RepID=UPI003F50E356